MTLLFDFESVFACQFGLGRKGVLPVPCRGSLPAGRTGRTAGDGGPDVGHSGRSS